MQQFKAFDERVEVSGGHLAAFVRAFPPGTEKIGADILNSVGLGNPNPQGWYRLQTLLDVMKQLQDRFTGTILTRMGYNVAQLVQLPPHWKSVEDALSELDKGYHMNHRGGEIGSYHYEYLVTETGLHRAKMVVKTHWPCEYELGLLQGMGDRYKQPETEIFVRKDFTAPCRKNGADSCTFFVTWT
ncbi:MAG: hypothetical protein AB1733_24945 [Thermodesulfobacteriota bacterium]